jgi:helix-turn-helix protein
MSPPNKCSSQPTPLNFDLRAAELAVEWLPKPDKEFRRARKRWTDYVRGSKELTAAQSQVGLTIADLYINRDPDHPWFNWAWPSHRTLAEKTGLCRRTVLSAVDRLLKVARGGGKKGLGGRTHRYTLNMAGLAAHEAQVGQIDPTKDAENLHIFRNSGSTDDGERGAIRDAKLRNPRRQDVKRLPTNLINKTKESVIEPPTSSASAERKRSGKESRTPSYSVTSMDHTNLAMCVGDGNLGEGYERLLKIPEDKVNDLALRLKQEPSAANSIRLLVEVDLRTREPVNTIAGL